MIQKTEFILTGSGEKIILGDNTYDDSHTKPEVILFIHGFKGFKDWGAHNLIAEFFASRGYRFVKFNLSHSGVMPENPIDVKDMDTFAANTISKELADVNTVINYIAHTYAGAKITLIGHSRGGGLAISKGEIDPRIHRVVTWSAVSDFSSLWKPEQEEEWKRTGRIYVENARTKEKMPLGSELLMDYKAHKKEFDIIEAASRLNIPWLILHGDEDVNVPFFVAQQLAQAQPNAIINKVAGANHVYGASHPYTERMMPPHLQEVCEKTLQFIKETPG
ncbi:alpha/beta hydrolase family protein [Pedobacter sp.]|uniref:alpha/beta hydrolase family protein n=1 Tax=Pedobacter sp. TaxID=1411316 RepID=UPI003D7F5907